MCEVRTLTFQGPELELYGTMLTTPTECAHHAHEVDDLCIWPVVTEVWALRGGEQVRLDYLVVAVPSHWTFDEIRDCMTWPGGSAPEALWLS